MCLSVYSPFGESLFPLFRCERHDKKLQEFISHPEKRENIRKQEKNGLLIDQRQKIGNNSLWPSSEKPPLNPQMVS